MAADLSLLVDPFEAEITGILGALLLDDGFQLRPFFTRRHPLEQARLWRQSRTTTEVHTAASMLAREGAVYLRGLLLSVGPQHGKWATNALPGQSWHQWDEAIDCFVMEHGRAVWRRDHPGYRRYAEKAREAGLTAGFFWRHQDAVHVQAREGRVRSLFTWAQIDQDMQRRFGVPAEPAETLDEIVEGGSIEDLVQAAEKITRELERRK